MLGYAKSSASISLPSSWPNEMFYHSETHSYQALMGDNSFPGVRND